MIDQCKKELDDTKGQCDHKDFKEEAALRLAGVYDFHMTTSIIEQKLVRLDGSMIDIEVITSPIPHMKNVGITLIRDITDR